MLLQVKAFEVYNEMPDAQKLKQIKVDTACYKYLPSVRCLPPGDAIGENRKCVKKWPLRKTPK
mgnify:CR=1 FL=1